MKYLTLPFLRTPIDKCTRLVFSSATSESDPPTISGFSPAHEFFGSRKLRLAPQDYSPWTPPLDRFLVRSYPPASRYPRVLDLVGPHHGVQCHPERSEPASEVEGSAPRRLERLGRGSFAGSGWQSACV